MRSAPAMMASVGRLASLLLAASSPAGVGPFQSNHNLLFADHNVVQISLSSELFDPSIYIPPEQHRLPENSNAGSSLRRAAFARGCIYLRTLSW